MKNYLIILLAFFLVFSTALSQEDDYEEEQIEALEIHHPSNEIGIFLGATSYTGVGSWTAFTVGLEYERIFHFTPAVFLGAYAEMVTGDHSEYLFGVPVGIEFSNIKLFMAPSLVIEKEHSTIQNSEENLKESTTKFFLRLGTGYKLHLNSFSLVPNIAVDIISSKTYVVYGLTIGYGF